VLPAAWPSCTRWRHFGIDALLPAKGALRQGVIIDLHERLQAQRRARRHGDLRDASVAELQQRFEVDVPQARRVARWRWRCSAGLPQADADQRRELGWACATCTRWA
jgi:exopolyphosphatase/guanosine-5'-triphosphate,3'-diphosphate pyrophosphatase